MDHVALSVGGASIPCKTLQPDFETGDYMNYYMSLFSSMGCLYQDEGNHIDREECNKAYTLICFDLSPDLEEGFEKNWQFHSRCTSKKKWQKP